MQHILARLSRILIFYSFQIRVGNTDYFFSSAITHRLRCCIHSLPSVRPLPVTKGSKKNGRIIAHERHKKGAPRIRANLGY